MIGEAIKRQFPVLKDKDQTWSTMKQKFCRRLQYVRSKLSTEKRMEMQRRYTKKNSEEAPKRKKALVTFDMPQTSDRPMEEAPHRDVWDEIAADSRRREVDVDNEDREGKCEDLSMSEKTRSECADLVVCWPSNMTNVAWTMRQLEETFASRKDEAMRLSVLEEVQRCPPLQHPTFLLKEAEMVLSTYVKNPNSPYCLPNTSGCWEAIVEASMKRVSVVTGKMPTDLMHSDKLIWDTFSYIVKHLRESRDSFFEDGGEAIFIMGKPDSPECAVCVNGLKIPTTCPSQTVAIFTLSFLAFNLRHSIRQEATLEAFECLFGIRQRFSKNNARNFMRQLCVI